MPDSFTFLTPALMVAGPAVVVILALLTREGVSRDANRILAIIVGILTILCVEHAITMMYRVFWARYLPWVPPLGFLLAPGIALYARTLLANGLIPITRRDLVHTIPFLCAYVATTTWSLSGGRPLRLQPIQEAGKFFLLANAVISAGYLAASWVQYFRRDRPLNGGTSPLVRLEDRWLRYVLWLFGILWIALVLLFATQFSPTMTLLVYLTMVGVVIAIAAFGLRWSALFLPPDSVRALTKVEGPPRYATSGLTAAEVAERSKELLAHLETSRCFLQSDLKSEDLARALRITEYQLSQVLNVGLGENFFSLVSRYRIDEAKRILGDAGGNILEVAYEVGFNSKSTFNTAFKKLTGETPSAFRKRHHP